MKIVFLILGFIVLLLGAFLPFFVPVHGVDLLDLHMLALCGVVASVTGLSVHNLIGSV